MREKYVILKSTDSDSLERKVLQLMELNYVALGGVAVSYDGNSCLFVQAMELL
jgi:hypothetical protein